MLLLNSIAISARPASQAEARYFWQQAIARINPLVRGWPGEADWAGRATKGISTAKKRRVSRQNLALARAAKKVLRIKAETDHAMALLGPIRQAEIAQAEAAAAESRTRLKDHEPKIMADPLLRRVYALLKRSQASDAVAREVNGG